MSDKPSRRLKPSTVRIGRRYRPNRLEGPYDAIVIGSGIGGMTAAACLSELGRRVVVFEQHYTTGGFTHSYARNGYEWDVGVHYIGDVGAPHTLTRRLFDFVSGGRLEWASMDEHYDRIFLGDRHFDLVATPKAFRAELLKHFPGEERALDEYLKRLGQVTGFMPLLTMEKLLPQPLARVLGLWKRWRSPAWIQRSTREVLEELTSDQTLIAVLCGQWGDNGLPPAESSFIIHALIARHYLYGGYYPVGGASRISESIIPQVQKSGGEVFTYADVEEILTAGGKVKGVRMADGTQVPASVVISNAGVFNTFARLLPGDLPEVARYRQRLTQVRRSMSSMCLYVGLQATAEELELPKTNYWLYPGENYEQRLAEFMADPENREIPLVYISFPSAKDPSFTDRYPGRATIEIVAPGPWEWFQKWSDTPWGKRGEDYETLKEKWSQRLLERLYEHFPHLRGRIDYHELSTPLSTDHFCNYQRGEIYGLEHTPGRFRQDWLKPATSVPGLYLTGQDVMSCGVAGAMIGGLMAAVAAGGVQGWKLAGRFFRA